MPVSRVATMPRWPVVLMICILVATGPVPVRAQEETVRVLSGEHESFTRLALALPRPVPWRFERIDGDYVLRLERTGIALDVSQVFARIPRERLRDVAMLAPPATGLELDLAPATSVRAFEDRPGLIVVDMRTGPPPPNPALHAADTGEPEPAGPALSEDAVTWLDWADLRAPTQAPKAPATGDGGKGPHPAADTGLSAARDLLLRQLGRAAAQGLLEVDLPRPVPPDDAPRPSPLGDPGPVAVAAPGVGARTALDGAASRMAETGAPSGGCDSDAALDVSAWGGRGDAAAQIAARRAAVFGSDGAPGDDAAVELARSYLHHGFGAEARATLETLGAAAPRKDHLAAMADIVDGRPVADDNPLAPLVACDGPAALWGLVASRDLSPRTPVARDAALRAFSALPPPLRRRIAPRAVRAFLQTGHEDAARSIRDAVARAPGSETARFELMTARLELGQGRREAATQRLRRIAGTQAHGAADALALYGELTLDAGESLPEELVTAAGPAAAERRGTALGTRLAGVHVLGLAALGRFDAAFSARDRLARRGDPAAADLSSGLLTRLAEKASDATFAVHAFSDSSWRRGALPEAARLAVAERLVSVGFPEAAQDALTRDFGASPGEQRLRARAALRSGNARRALRVLAGESGASMARLRSAALSHLGDNAAAAAALKGLDADRRRARLAWRAGDWELVRRLGTPEQKAVLAEGDAFRDFSDAHGRAAKSDGAAAPPGALARARVLVSQSDAMRARLDALLDSHPAAPAEGDL